MSKQQRLNRILDLLAQEGQVDIERIVAATGVSAATARRDLNTLADNRLVARTHGGAVAVGSAYELPLQYKIARNSTGKKAIAHAAAQLVRQGESVGLTGGTTTSEIARELGMSPHLESDNGEPGVTIVTNALNIAYEMAIRPHVKIVVTGGTARVQTFELVGPLVESTIATLSLDWAFVGVNGLHSRYGAATIDEGEAKVNRILARSARRIVVVADTSKMMQASFARILDFSEFDMLIVDEPPPQEIQHVAEANSTEIIVASPGGNG